MITYNPIEIRINQEKVEGVKSNITPLVPVKIYGEFMVFHIVWDTGLRYRLKIIKWMASVFVSWIILNSNRQRLSLFTFKFIARQHPWIFNGKRFKYSIVTFSCCLFFTWWELCFIFFRFSHELENMWHTLPSEFSFV